MEGGKDASIFGNTIVTIVFSTQTMVQDGEMKQRMGWISLMMMWTCMTFVFLKNGT